MRLKSLLLVSVFLWGFVACADVAVSVFQPELQAGYFRTLVFQLSNRGDAEVKGKIRIDFKNTNRWTRDFTLSPHAKSTVRVVLPENIMRYSAELSVQIGNSIIWHDPDFRIQGLYADKFLYSNDLSETLACRVLGVGNGKYRLAPFPPEAIGANDTDFWGVTKIVLSGQAWHELPADRRENLLKYAAAGCVLVILDPAAKQQSQTCGLGLVMTLNPETPDEEVMAAADNVKWWDTWRHDLDFQTPARQLNIHAVFFIMLVVSLLIGPGVYFYCARRKKLVHTVWLIPTLSFGFALVLIVYIGWSEGWQAIGQVQNKIFLDLPGKTAYCFSSNGYFSSVFPPGDLVVSEEANFYASAAWQSGSPVANLDVFDNGRQQYWGNFLQSRSKNIINTYTRAELPDYFEFRRLSPERILVISRYPAALRNFELIDETGVAYTAGEVMPGSQTEAQKTSAAPCQEEFSSQNFFQNQPFRLGFRAEAAARVFPPGVWVKTDRFTEKTAVTGRIGGIK